MNLGHWIPLCKALVSELPHRETRPYTKLEAMFCVAIDYDSDKKATVSGYSALWRWSERKVRRFLEETGVALRYPENTGSKQNQRGEIVIVITERKRRESGEIRAINSRWLGTEAERKRRENGEKAERSAPATIDPDPEPDPKSKRFVPPTLEDVAAYCLERRNSVDHQRFIDHYQSNGWKVGKNHMKDWKAAVRTWEKDDSQRGSGKASHFPRLSSIRHDAGIAADGRF